MEQIQKYYEVLGVAPQATIEEIKQAYFDLVTIWRPDKYSHDSRLYKKASDKIRDIDAAYQGIMNASKGRTICSSGYKDDDERTRLNKSEQDHQTENKHHWETGKNDNSQQVLTGQDETKGKQNQVVNIASENDVIGVGGWLLFLCVCLTILQPLHFLLSLLGIFRSWSEGNPFTFIFGGITLAYWAFYGFVIGRHLYTLKEDSVEKAKKYFMSMRKFFVVLISITALGLIFGSIIWKSALGDFIFAFSCYAILGMLTVAWPTLWIEYLRKSKRVRATYKNKMGFDVAKHHLREALLGIDKELRKDDPLSYKCDDNEKEKSIRELNDTQATFTESTGTSAAGNINAGSENTIEGITTQNRITVNSSVSSRNHDEKRDTLIVHLPKKYLLRIAIAAVIIIFVTVLSHDSLRYKTERIGFWTVRYDRLSSQVYVKDLGESDWQQSTNDFEITKAYLRQAEAERASKSMFPIGQPAFKNF